jgi:hypothetical protein
MILVKDMALTFEDFRRGLPAAMAGLDYSLNDRTVSTGDARRGITITVEPLPPRVLGGLLRVERSKVTIVFQGYDESDRASFLECFDRGYQRGGG